VADNPGAIPRLYFLSVGRYTVKVRPLLVESGRQSCLKIDLFSGDGVVEFQILGVQEISSIAGEAGEIFKRLAG
jgi:hypothetical protein